MKEVIVKFWCNAGHTEEEVTVEIHEGEDKTKAIEEAFIKWLDNNEQCGWEVIE